MSNLMQISLVQLTSYDPWTQILVDVSNNFIKKGSDDLKLETDLQASPSGNEIFSYYWAVFLLHKKCSNEEFFLVCIFQHSYWIRENKDQKKYPNFDTFLYWNTSKISKKTKIINAKSISSIITFFSWAVVNLD